MQHTSNPATLRTNPLVKMRLERVPISYDEADRPSSEEEAYRLQAANNQLLSQAGLGPIIGHKIGCTTPVMQKFLNIGSPCAGDMFSKSCFHEKAFIHRADYLRPGVECEIAVILGKDIPADGHPPTLASVTNAVDAAMAAIEIVDDRYADYRTLGVETLIADNFFNAGCVLGNPITNWQEFDLSTIMGRMEINGVPVGQGSGALVMGHPFEALLWLARSRHARGLGLEKRYVILLGSLVETRWVNAGDTVKIQIEQLGDVLLEIR